MNETRTRTRIFLSCGQNPNYDELRWAETIKSMLESEPFNFDVYMANLEHTRYELLGAVLHALEASEYFLFIDFKREQLKRSDNEELYRGSLFSHQELAIATFLGVDQLRFCERGVELNGIANQLQGRPHEFSSREELSDLVRKQVATKWTNGWLNALKIHDRPQIESVPRSGGGTADFYHLIVENLHKRILALDCRVYLEVEDDDSSLSTQIRDHVEQKWAGVMYNQSVAIRPDHGYRRVCALFIERDNLSRSKGVCFHQFGVDTDSAAVAAECPTGQYRLKFSAVSTNFPVAEKEFRLVISEENEVSSFIAIPTTSTRPERD